MSSEERVYTINLGKVLLSQSQHRAVRAINMIREFASRHMGASEIKIDEDLAHQIWARGVRRPPRKIRVRMWTGTTGEIIVSRYDGDAEPGAIAEPPVPAGTEAGQEPAPEVGAAAGPSEQSEVEPKATEPETDGPADKPAAAAPKADAAADPSETPEVAPKTTEPETDGPADKPAAAAPKAETDDQPSGQDAKDRGAGKPDKKD